ncbi:MAG: hypothetical protein AB7V56_10405 [Candidatus Nitrosocosmicus sp.]
MEERQFLHKLCAIALQIDISIEFAGIMDSNGKLLVGKSRNKFSYHDIYKKRKNKYLQRNTKTYGKAIFKEQNISVNNIKSIVSLQSSLVDDQVLFRLINLNDDMFLAYMPINELKNKFLYIYFKTGEYIEDVLVRLDSAFS